MALTDQQYAEVERYNAWAKKLNASHQVARRTQEAFGRRGRVIAAMRRSSTSSRGLLEQLTAFPTAVFNLQLGAWQLHLPGEP